MRSLKKDNFVRNPSQRKFFEYANTNELSNIIMAYHLKDKPKLLHKKVTNLFCSIVKTGYLDQKECTQASESAIGH